MELNASWHGSEQGERSGKRIRQNGESQRINGRQQSDGLPQRCDNKETVFKQGLKRSMFRKEEFSDVKRGFLRFGKVIC